MCFVPMKADLRQILWDRIKTVISSVVYFGIFILPPSVTLCQDKYNISYNNVNQLISLTEPRKRSHEKLVNYIWVILITLVNTIME